ncbi:MAG: hypothetical protein E7185_07170 [Erysipelotrichaceae bacterium]|nr:hypothetical protein [Erysipelotrichaceae bacterium]
MITDMEFKKIYFDMDGVLADFDRGVRELLGFEPMSQENHTREYDDKLFTAIREHGDFYAQLEVIDESLLLFNELYSQYGGEVVEILTGVPNPKREIFEATGNKIDWVRRYMPEGVVVNALARKEKVKFCLGPEYILIDDFSLNIREWKKAGGTGILYTGADDVRRKLQELSEE